MKRYVTTREVAEEFSLTEPTIRSWIKEGVVPGLRLGRKFLIPVEEFDRMKKEGVAKNAQ